MNTAAVANYVHLTKHQLIVFQEAMCRRAAHGASNGGLWAGGNTINQEDFISAMDEVKISRWPDQDVLLNLFIMWDVMGNGKVPAHHFSLGLAPLACGGDSLATVLAFALQMDDPDGNGRVSSSQVLELLKCKSPEYSSSCILLFVPTRYDS